MAKDFVEQFNIPFPVYTDPERKTYEFMQFQRGVSIRWSMLKGAYQAYKKGHRQDGVQGDAWQLGGEALIDTHGTILWSHHAKNAEDHASIEIVLEAVQKYGKR